jgi:hypothetical protein
MTSLTITWNAINDAKTCPICRDLHGHSWVFAVSDEPMPDSLTHPQYGVVWNTTIGSQAHGHQRFNCRCSIALTDLNMTDVRTKIDIIKADLEARLSEQPR